MINNASRRFLDSQRREHMTTGTSDDGRLSMIATRADFTVDFSILSECAKRILTIFEKKRVKKVSLKN